MSNLIKMVYAGSPAPTQLVTQLGNTYAPDATGAIYVLPNDVISALASGWAFFNSNFRFFTATAPAAASAVVTVASVALSNGALTIAAQPDVLRPLQFVVTPGASAITGGTLTLVYFANDGTTTTDVLPLAAAASTPATLNTSKGVLLLSSATVAGLVGGTSPTIKGGTTAAISVPVDAGFSAFTVLRENVDSTNETVGTVAAASASITTTTAPNGTHSFSLGYLYTVPG